VKYFKKGDLWGLGIGDWPNPQSPIPNPQSPIPNLNNYAINFKIFFQKLFQNTFFRNLPALPHFKDYYRIKGYLNDKIYSIEQNKTDNRTTGRSQTFLYNFIFLIILKKNLKNFFKLLFLGILLLSCCLLIN